MRGPYRIGETTSLGVNMVPWILLVFSSLIAPIRAEEAPNEAPVPTKAVTTPRLELHVTGPRTVEQVRPLFEAYFEVCLASGYDVDFQYTVNWKGRYSGTTNSSVTTDSDGQGEQPTALVTNKRGQTVSCTHKKKLRLPKIDDESLSVVTGRIVYK